MAKFLFLVFCVTICCISPSFGSPSRYLKDSMRFRSNISQQTSTPETGNQIVETTASPYYMPPKVCECSDIYDPVCGTNSKSYYNQCQMECELGPNSDVTIVHLGNCIPY